MVRAAAQHHNRCVHAVDWQDGPQFWTVSCSRWLAPRTAGRASWAMTLSSRPDLP